MIENTNDAEQLAEKKRSHTLLLFCNAASGQTESFSNWFSTEIPKALSALDKVLSVQVYGEYPFRFKDRYKPIGFDYLAIVQLGLDGAEEADRLIEQIDGLYQNESSAGDLASWLYYPVSEKVGCNDTNASPSSPIITIAFANAVKGREAEFREWYSTQHIRHALIIPALISGQRFELTEFQSSGAMASDYQTIAIYEQNDTPENMVASFPHVDPVKGAKVVWSPSGDLERFTEWAYQNLN